METTQLYLDTARLGQISRQADWLPYRTILETEARRADRRMTLVSVRSMLASNQTTEEEVVEALKRRFHQSKCDGLFLTAVSHQGIRFPVEKVVRALESVREPRFVVIDGAQDFCHLPAELSNEFCDLYLAGSHKWLQGFHPMGLGFYGRHRSRARIETLLKLLLASGEIEDPLLRFTRQLETATLDADTETVNLFQPIPYHGKEFCNTSFLRAVI